MKDSFLIALNKLKDDKDAAVSETAASIIMSKF